MKVNMDKLILNLEGKEFDHEGKKLTVGRVCSIALSTPLEDDRSGSAEKVVARWKLCLRVHAGGEVELTPEEATEIRGRIPKVVFSLDSAAQAIEALS